MNNDERYMKEALKQAKKAALIDEVPIGCVIVHDEKISARGYNKRNKLHSTLGHAEISAIKKASKVLDDWRVYHVCYTGTMPYVCGGYSSGENTKGSYRSNESKSGLRRKYFKYVSDKGV